MSWRETTFLSLFASRTDSDATGHALFEIPIRIAARRLLTFEFQNNVSSILTTI